MMGAHAFTVGSSIPVLRMYDEAQARSFYLDYLGYEVDWEHRFRNTPESPLYMQVRLGKSVLHLNGHATQDTPAVEVRIPIFGLAAFHGHLVEQATVFETPEAVDPRYEGINTDLNLYDPFQNHLVFWERTGKEPPPED